MWLQGFSVYNGKLTAGINAKSISEMFVVTIGTP